MHADFIMHLIGRVGISNILFASGSKRHNVCGWNTVGPSITSRHPSNRGAKTQCPVLSILSHLLCLTVLSDHFSFSLSPLLILNRFFSCPCLPPLQCFISYTHSCFNWQLYGASFPQCVNSPIIASLSPFTDARRSRHFYNLV